MKHVGALVLLCLILPALSCHAAGENSPADIMVNGDGTWYRVDRQLTEHHFGQTIKTPQGSLLDLALAENASTGYSWRCQWQPLSGVTLVRTMTVGPKRQIPGAGGTRHFLLLVSRAGECKVTLQYGRWWKGGDRQPVKTITIDATPAAAR